MECLDPNVRGGLNAHRQLYTVQEAISCSLMHGGGIDPVLSKMMAVFFGTAHTAKFAKFFGHHFVHLVPLTRSQICAIIKYTNKQKE